MCGTTVDTNTVAVIYGLHKGDHDIRYIGLTTVLPALRLSHHLTSAKRHPNRYVCRWINKNGPENIRMCIIETFTEETKHLLKEREIFHIADAKGRGLKLVNSTVGGDGRLGYVTSEETKLKQSEARKGIIYSEETKEKMRQAKLGKKLSDEHKAKIGAAGIGRKQSAETIAKRLATKAGKPVKSNHTRYHTNRNIIKDGCSYCASAQQEAA